jgi:RNA polymerase sigma-70 factor, ECF subfamily
MSAGKPQMSIVESGDRLRMVDAAARGDRQAAASLLQEFLPRMRNLIRYLSRNDIDTDDLTQDAAVTVLRSLHTYRGEGYFERWVDRVVMRATFVGLKRRRFERSFAVLDGGESALMPAEGGQPDEYMARRSAIRLLDELPIEQRHVLVLHHVLEMSVPEIATELEIPFETVRSRLRLARQRLRLVAWGPTTEEGWSDA